LLVVVTGASSYLWFDFYNSVGNIQTAVTTAAIINSLDLVVVQYNNELSDSPNLLSEFLYYL